MMPTEELLEELRGDGYPTKKGLAGLRKFTGSAHELADLLHEAMKAYGVVVVKEIVDRYGRDVREVYIATGGWSGNESIIGALDDTFFWFAYWEQSARGGAFWFRVPADRWDNPMPEWPPAELRNLELET